MKKQPLVIIIVCLTALLVVFTTLKFPHNIEAPFEIISKKEWTLVKIAPDKLESRLVENSSNKELAFTLLQFDRDDFVGFTLFPDLENKQIVQANDTIAIIYSSKNQLLLADLKAELNKAEASLNIARTGEKRELQEEAFQTLQIAKIELSSFEPQYFRKKELFEKSLISKEEWETADASYHILKTNVILAKSRIDVITTGEKKEIIQSFTTQVNFIKKQIAIVNDKLKFETIRTPIDGIISFSGIDNIICCVNETDTLLIRLAIPLKDSKYISDKMIPDYFIPETGNQYNADIKLINKTRSAINGIAVIIVTAIIENPVDGLLPGMSGHAKIPAESITIFTRLQRELDNYTATNLL